MVMRSEKEVKVFMLGFELGSSEMLSTREVVGTFVSWLCNKELE